MINRADNIVSFEFKLLENKVLEDMLQLIGKEKSMLNPISFYYRTHNAYTHTHTAYIQKNRFKKFY